MIIDNLSFRDLRSYYSCELVKALNIDIDVALLEVDLLLLESFFLIENKDLTRANILARLSEVVETQVLNKFNELIERRKLGEPIAYILNKKDFFGLTFYVDKRVLVPRPETEILVQKVIEVLKLNNLKFNILDIGTGSGAIICAIVKQIKFEKMLDKLGEAYGIDNSVDALAVCKKNIDILDLADEIKILEYSMLEPDKILGLIGEDSPYIIVSNPPYLDRDDQDICEMVRKYEPESALYSEKNGYEHIEALISMFINTYKTTPNSSSKTNHLFMEIGHNQGDRIKSYVQKWPYIKCETLNDLSGLTRVVHITFA